MASTYILICNDNSYYIGSSDNLEQRLSNHNRKKCRYTKSRLPIKLVFEEHFSSLSQAKKREYQLKSWKSRSAIEKLIKSNSRGPVV